MALFLAMLLLFLPLGAYGQSQAAPPEAQKKAPAAEESPRRPPEILELIGRAHAVPPEFGADALIRIALSSKVNDPEWKRELLEEAFYLAGSATEPVRRSAVVTLHNGNSRSGYRAQGYDYNLDGLSLQARAVRSLLAVDRKRALKLLGDVRLPELPTLTCKDVFIYQVNDFYEDTVTEAANRAFTPEETSRGENFTFIENYVKDLRSPAQIGPLANLLATVKVTPEQFAQLVQTYSVMLAGVPPDLRTSNSYLHPMYGIQSLAGACRDRGVSPVPLLNAARVYMMGVFSRRCGDTAELDQWRFNQFNSILEVAESENPSRWRLAKRNSPPSRSTRPLPTSPPSGATRSPNSCSPPSTICGAAPICAPIRRNGNPASTTSWACSRTGPERRRNPRPIIFTRSACSCRPPCRLPRPAHCTTACCAPT